MVNTYYVKLIKQQEIELEVAAKSSKEAKAVALVKLRTGEAETTTETEWEFADVKGIHDRLLCAGVCRSEGNT